MGIWTIMLVRSVRTGTNLGRAVDMFGNDRRVYYYPLVSRQVRDCTSTQENKYEIIGLYLGH